MRDNPLRQLLDSVEAEERSWTALLSRLDELNLQPSPDADSVKAAVRGYLGDTAALLDSVGEAVEGGRVDWVEVLDAAHGYLGNRDDLLSDDEGVLGVLDDAYLCRALLRYAADGDSDAPVTVPVTMDEDVVRRLLGGPVAAALDVGAQQTVRDIRSLG
jgi:hypothetical protein